MCLTVLAYETHPKYRFIIASNRDEFYERPSWPAHFWEEYPHLLAGKDLQDEGTWFGITQYGKLALLTNVRDPASSRKDRPSRGSLVKRFLQEGLSPEDYLQELLSGADKFNGFNLIFGTVTKLFYFSNHPLQWQRIKPGIHALSNANLNTPWPKVEFAKNSLHDLITNNVEISEYDLFQILFNDSTYSLENLPDTGVGAKLEKMLSPVFIYSPNYGTRSSTVVLIDYHDQVTFTEKTFDKPEDGFNYPARMQARENRHFFQLQPLSTAIFNRTKQINLQVSIYLLFMLLILQAPLTFANSSTINTPLPLHIELPGKVAMGEPFTVKVKSRINLDKVELTWLGKTVSLPLRKKQQEYTNSILLGTDVKKQEAGRKAIVVKTSNSGLESTKIVYIDITSKSFPVQKLQLPPSEVGISESKLNRHKKEKKRINETLKIYSRDRLWDCPFLSPVPGEITSSYGLKRFLNDKPRSPHRGLDYSAKYREPVRATNKGKVILTGNHLFAGKSVYIHHGQGVVSMYFHLSEIKTRQGQRVQKGQTIGLCGKTGRVTASHLHFSLSILGDLVNPKSLLESKCFEHTK